MQIQTTLTAEQRIRKAIVAIMHHSRYTALAGVLLIGKREVVDDPRVPTACTNGKDERYSRAFVEQLNDRELRFLILHEVYHKIYRHLISWRWMYKENPTLANIACDMVINTQLVAENAGDNFATMTGLLKNGCYDAKYNGWDSARVYHDLKKQGSGQDSSGGQSGQGFDIHDWDSASELTAEEAQQLVQEIDSALRQGAIAAGKMGTGGDRTFEDLLAPETDWRAALSEFVQETCRGNDYSTWRRPNRRYVGADMYMPSGVSEAIGDIVLGIDTSGSTFAPGVLPRMMSEVAGIVDVVKPTAVHILYWDTEICGAERYEQHELDTMIQTTRPKGGGGTNVECVPQHMQKNNITPQCAVVFTDGYLSGSWGVWSCPVLWVIVDNKGCVPPFGSVVHVSSAAFQ